MSAEKERLISLTVGDDPQKAKVLTQSFEKFGHTEYHVLGAGEPWYGGDMKSYGGGQKIVLMKRFLNSRSFSDDDVILFSDGYDSFVCGTPEEFLRKWRQYRCDIVFGSESVNWPGNVKTQPPVANRFQFLNSGGYIGLANVLKDMFNSKEIMNKDDDQGYCQQLYVESLEHKKWSIRLDFEKRIFCCISDHVRQWTAAPSHMRPIRMVSENMYHVDETDSYPLQLHGNGPGKNIWVELSRGSGYL
jgi:hypothetical protein